MRVVIVLVVIGAELPRIEEQRRHDGAHDPQPDQEPYAEEAKNGSENRFVRGSSIICASA